MTKRVALAGATSFLGINALSMSQRFLETHEIFAPGMPSIYMAAMGSSAAIIFAFPQAPFSQPRNVLWSHPMGAAIGLACGYIPHECLAGPAAVSVTVMAMLATKTFHPPSAGSALFVAASVGMSPLIVPAFFLSSSVLVSVAMLFGNLINYPASITKAKT